MPEEKEQLSTHEYGLKKIDMIVGTRTTVCLTEIIRIIEKYLGLHVYSIEHDSDEGRFTIKTDDRIKPDLAKDHT